MKPTQPLSRTTLALNAHFRAIGFLTARDVMRHLVVGNVKGFDAASNLLPWEAPKGEPCWSRNEAFLYDDQPSLRSASAEFALPTIVVLQKHTGYPSQKKRRKALSLRQIFDLYDETCQYCLKPITFKEATKDHVRPRAKGGGNETGNLVLACFKCNNKKADHYPYPNVREEEVVPKILGDIELLDGSEKVKNPRPEWTPFLPKKVGKKLSAIVVTV